MTSDERALLTIREATEKDRDAHDRAMELGYLECPKYELRTGGNPIADLNEREWAERICMAVNLHDELVAALRKCQIELHMIVNIAGRKGGMYEAALNEANTVLNKLLKGQST